MTMHPMDWAEMMRRGRRRFAEFASVGELPPEPTPAEAARLTVARGRVQAEHDAVMAEVARLYANERDLDADDLDALREILDDIDRMMPHVDGGVAYELYGRLAALRDVLGLPGTVRYPGGS